MWIKKGSKWVRLTGKDGFVTPSQLKARREAFERKKKTKAFRKWRYNKYLEQNKRCALCGRPINGALITDHIKPLAMGGTSAYSNLQITHWSCNARKGIKSARTNN